MADINSQFYPYTKVYQGYSTMIDTRKILRQVMDYILDMPDQYYTPIDDNARARVRLWKLLFYDGKYPLANALPTTKEKKSVLFDPDNPTNPTEKGWRLIPQVYIKQAQTEAQTRINVYMGRTIAQDDFTQQLSVCFDIWTNYTEEANTKTYDGYSRAFDIEQAIVEAFNGVVMTGVGSFYFSRQRHADCGSTPMQDKDSNVGRHLVIGLEVKSTTINDDYLDDVPLGNGYMG